MAEKEQKAHSGRRIRVSKNQTWKRGKRSKGPSKSMKIRANAVILSVILTAAAGLAANLFHIMIVQHDEYTAMANSRQFGTVKLPAARGTIYDANETVLAQSATVYLIFLDPQLFQKEMEMVEKRNQELIEQAQKKQEEGENVKADVVDPEQIKSQLITFLAETLELTEKEVREAFDKTESRYVKLKKQVEKSRADRIIEYISDIHVQGSSRTITLSSISRESDTKRYYPQYELAASVIGFTNSDGKGFYGVEKYYDSYLSGLDGKTITARDASGNEMPYRYSKTYPAQDGDDIYLTIDMTLQTYLENALTDMVKTYNVGKRACGIMQNCKTGAILAMATVGGFDANEPYELFDPKVKAQVESIRDEDERTKALIAAREQQWRNKCVSETYVPGSVFKVYTASAGLEENKVNYETDSFYCSGSVVVSGVTIHCSNHRGHKQQNFEDILRNSCNPAFIEIGQRLGKTLFSRYFAAFGLTERTGIDLPGEASSIYTPESKMSLVDLAASSYGQHNSLTPIEMVTGYSAVVNGGYLLKPYVVSKIVDKSGNVVLTNEKSVRRQVVSEDTSAQMRRALQALVDNNSGNNAYIKGYKIGGKSGTSEKLTTDKTKPTEYVASYSCFAPADDPEIVLLIMADEPDRSISYYGATVVAPYSRSIMEKTLPYLGFYPSYSDEEQQNLDVTIPMLIDSSVEDAEKALQELGLNYDIIGAGDTVNLQMPITGTEIAKGGTVLLYTGATAVPEKVTVPLVRGMTLEEANEALTEAGLNYVAKGSGAADAEVLMQSITPGTQVDKWTVVNLDLGSSEDNG